MQNDLGTMRRKLRRRGDAAAVNSRGWIPAASADFGASGPSLQTRISHGCSIRAEDAARQSWFSRFEIMVDQKPGATCHVAEAHGRAGTAHLALSLDERRQWIAKAAYLRAAARDFAGGDPLHDWLAAEAEINALVERESAKDE